MSETFSRSATRILAITFSVVALIIGISANSGTSVATEVSPFPLSSQEEMEAGTFLKFHRGMMDLKPETLRTMREVLSDEGLEKFADAATRKTPDDLARDLAEGLDGVLSISAVWRYFYNMTFNGFLPEDVAMSATNRVTLADGTTAIVPTYQADEYHAARMNAAVHELARREAAPAMAKHYSLVAKGDCPIADGPIEMGQDSHFVYGSRGNVDLVAGAVHTGGGWFMANGDRFGAILSEDNIVISIEAPDKPGQIFQLQGLGSTLILTTRVGAPCTLTLTIAK